MGDFFSSIKLNLVSAFEISAPNFPFVQVLQDDIYWFDESSNNIKSEIVIEFDEPGWWNVAMYVDHFEDFPFGTSQYWGGVSIGDEEIVCLPGGVLFKSIYFGSEESKIFLEIEPGISQYLSNATLYFSAYPILY